MHIIGFIYLRSCIAPTRARLGDPEYRITVPKFGNVRIKGQGFVTVKFLCGAAVSAIVGAGTLNLTLNLTSFNYSIFSGERWQKMTEADKAPYQKMADDDKVRYTQELEAFRMSKMMMMNGK